MSIKFKLAESAPDRKVAEALEALASMYVIADKDEALPAVRKLLMPFESEVEYVEGSVTRKPLAG